MIVPNIYRIDNYGTNLEAISIFRYGDNNELNIYSDRFMYWMIEINIYALDIV